MITSTMTLEEIAKELLIDFREVYDRWNKFGGKFRRMSLNQIRFPWFWNNTIKTKRFNNWNIIFSAWSKKETKIVDPIFVVSFHYNGGTWTASLLKDLVLFFPLHFFERYKERFLKFNLEDLQISNKDIRDVFYALNNRIFLYKREREDSIRGFCYNGMILGDWIGENCGIVKTFISIEEMKVNQFAEYFDCLKNRLILDMYRCRKGIEMVYNSELVDCIPDTYFEYEEINNFLWNLENRLLTVTHRKCIDYYSKHKIEVDKCTHMLNAIMDNQ